MLMRDRTAEAVMVPRWLMGRDLLAELSRTPGFPAQSIPCLAVERLEAGQQDQTDGLALAGLDVTLARRSVPAGVALRMDDPNDVVRPAGDASVCGVRTHRPQEVQ
jgi:hypothetical protein